MVQLSTRELKLFLLCALGFRFTAASQVSSISFPNNTLVYAGTETPMQISVSGYNCNKIHVKTDNGQIKRLENCRYYFIPDRIGETMIDVYVIKKEDTFLTGRQFLYVKNRPLPEVSIGGHKGGLIKKNEFIVQQGIAAEFYISGNHWEYCRVQSYHVIVCRGDTILFTSFNQGNIFNQDVINFFKELRTGDKVSFINIKGCENIEGGGDLKSLEFKIDE